MPNGNGNNGQEPYNPYADKQTRYTDLQEPYGEFNQMLQDRWKNIELVRKHKDNDQWREIYQTRANEWNTKIEEWMSGDFGKLMSGAGVQMIRSGDNIRFLAPGQEGAGGGGMTSSALSSWLTGEVDRLGQRAAEFESTDFLFDYLGDSFQDTGTDYTVDPFEDENAWEDFIQQAFGDLQGMGDVQDLLMTFHDLMPMSDYSAEALPNLSRAQRMTKFFDDMKAHGFTATEYSGGIDQQLRDWLYTKAIEMDPRNRFGIDRSAFDNMAGIEIRELMKIIGRHNVLDDAEQREYVDAKMAVIRRREGKRFQANLAKLGELGVGYGGAVIRATADLHQVLVEAEMATTADIFMRGVELAEHGKLAAISQFGQLREDEIKIIQIAAGKEGEAYGQYLGFISEIGRISADEYSTKVEQHMHIADLTLKANLGIANLEMEKYRTDAGLDMEQLKLDYTNYWQGRGFSFEEKKQAFADAIVAWNTSTTMAQMVQSGNMDRLVQMASLAQKAWEGDMEAWGMYQQMSLTNALQTRGFDIQQAEALADLTWNRHQLGEKMDIQRWMTQHNAALQRELQRIGFENEMTLTEFKYQLEQDAKGGFWSQALDLGLSVAELYAAAQTGGGGAGGGGEGDGG